MVMILFPELHRQEAIFSTAEGMCQNPRLPEIWPASKLASDIAAVLQEHPGPIMPRSPNLGAHRERHEDFTDEATGDKL
jgi:hypothetical protein